MTRRSDHVGEALEFLDSEYGAHPNQLGYDSADVQHLLNMMAAQTHATLALVEQQRVANRIALATAIVSAKRFGEMSSLHGETGILEHTRDMHKADIHEDVADALGIPRAVPL